MYSTQRFYYIVEYKIITISGILDRQFYLIENPKKRTIGNVSIQIKFIQFFASMYSKSGSQCWQLHSFTNIFSNLNLSFGPYSCILFGHIHHPKQTALIDVQQRDCYIQYQYISYYTLIISSVLQSIQCLLILYFSFLGKCQYRVRF